MQDIASKCRQEQGWFTPCSYDDLIASYGHEVLLQVDDKDYQGDTRALLRDGDKIGHLQFGWGSCSWCDALQGCDSVEEVRELQQQLHDQIRWFPNTAEALAWFRSHDWKGEYSWHAEEQREYIEKAIHVLSSDAAPLGASRFEEQIDEPRPG